MSTTSPTFLSASAAARRLGLSARTLGRRAQQHDLFRPVGEGRFYHAYQMDLIEAVIQDAVDADTALLNWQVFLGKLRERLGAA